MTSVLLCWCHFAKAQTIFILLICGLNASSLFGKLFNNSLWGSIFISVSLTGCPHFEILLLFIHPQTPFTFFTLVVLCPPSVPSLYILPFFSPLSIPWWIMASSWLLGPAVDQNIIFTNLFWPESTLSLSLCALVLVKRTLACFSHHALSITSLFSHLLAVSFNLPSILFLWSLDEHLFVVHLLLQNTFILCFQLNFMLKT